MKGIITYGAFDLLRYGHTRLLKRARALGDYLIAGLSTDKLNELSKYKQAYNNYAERRYILEATRYVDQAIPEENWDRKISDAQKYNIDIFVVGNDWEGKSDSLKPYCKVKHLERIPGISTTQVEEDLK